ncbi:hypothetical protein BMS3Bbin02_00214 [bacterium BMS3Bbin02]|nr:hypothetical protein BMS3Bbin02_00214 [bacterium BMS3Bbin02]
MLSALEKLPRSNWVLMMGSARAAMRPADRIDRTTTHEMAVSTITASARFLPSANILANIGYAATLAAWAIAPTGTSIVRLAYWRRVWAPSPTRSPNALMKVSSSTTMDCPTISGSAISAYSRSTGCRHGIARFRRMPTRRAPHHWTPKFPTAAPTSAPQMNPSGSGSPVSAAYRTPPVMMLTL